MFPGKGQRFARKRIRCTLSPCHRIIINRSIINADMIPTECRKRYMSGRGNTFTSFLCQSVKFLIVQMNLAIEKNPKYVYMNLVKDSLPQD